MIDWKCKAFCSSIFLSFSSLFFRVLVLNYVNKKYMETNTFAIIWAYITIACLHFQQTPIFTLKCTIETRLINCIHIYKHANWKWHWHWHFCENKIKVLAYARPTFPRTHHNWVESVVSYHELLILILKFNQ